MSEIFKSRFPEVPEKDLLDEIRQSRTFFCGGTWSAHEIEIAYKIVSVAREVYTDVCQIEGKTGAILGISKREPGSPILFIQIGEILKDDPEYQGGKRSKYVDFVRGKIEYLQEHQEYIITRSSMNLELAHVDNKKKTKMTKKLVPGGAVAFENIVIGASGLSSDAKIDEDAILEIGKRLALGEGWHTGAFRAQIKNPVIT